MTMSRKKKEDIGYVVMLLASLAGIVLMLWFLLTIVSWNMDLHERCHNAGGEMTRYMKCVDAIENY